MWHGNGDSCSSPMSCLLLLQPPTTLGCSPGIKAEELLLLAAFGALGQTAQGGKERSLSLSVDIQPTFQTQLLCDSWGAWRVQGQRAGACSLVSMDRGSPCEVRSSLATIHMTLQNCSVP